MGDWFKMKRKYIYIGSLFIVIVLFGWMLFFYEDYSNYSYGKNSYEFDAQYGHKYGYDLTDAYEAFEEANGFWDSEDYLEKIEEEMYAFLKEYREQGKYPYDQFPTYTRILIKTERFGDESSLWVLEHEAIVKENNEQFENNIKLKPPYVGMDAKYISKTSWGPPTSTDSDIVTYQTRGLIAYHWIEGKIHRVAYVSEGEVFKVSY